DAGKISGSQMWTEAGAKLLASVAAKKLIADHGPEVLRYLLLSTHYRRPIEFSEQAISDAKKALGTFTRLFERLDRLTAGQPPVPNGTEGSVPDMDRASSALLEGPHAGYAQAVLGLKMKFLEMMDDDFNTAGAIAALHEIAGEVNAFLERNDADKAKPAEVVAAAVAGVRTLATLGGVIGLALHPTRAKAAAAADGGLAGQLMDLFIRLRADARQSKNFALADDIRKSLTAVGVTLEDGPEGTRWRKD
ncbi:MAG: Cysteinyl-tRNA synthetase, partial [uncultured Phycisphaerae bacterium]